MKNFIITSAVCIAMILSSASSMAQQITIVSGKVLNLPEGEKNSQKNGKIWINKVSVWY